MWYAEQQRERVCEWKLYAVLIIIQNCLSVTLSSANCSISHHVVELRSLLVMSIIRKLSSDNATTFIKKKHILRFVNKFIMLNADFIEQVHFLIIHFIKKEKRRK